MRTLRLLVGLSAVGSMVAAVATGCSSSDNPAGGGSSDSDASVVQNDSGGPGPGPGPGTDGSSSVDSATPPTVTVAGADLNVYLGQIAELDASGTTVAPVTPLAYKWTVDSAPAGSTVVTTSLFNAGSAKPSFTPDVAGDYKVKVTVTAGTATADKVVTVKAFEAQTVFLYTDGDGGVFGRSGMRATATLSDAGAHDLSCHVSDAGPYDDNAPLEMQLGADAWEGPAGTDSKAAYVHQIKLRDAGSSYQLLLVSTSSTCAAAPVLLDEFANTNDGLLVEPRISPNGQRVAYVHKPNASSGIGDHVKTVGADGTVRRSVGSFAAHPDGGPFPDAAVPFLQTPAQFTSPRWMNDTTVGWMQFPAGKTWNVVVADDVDNATAAIYMTCTSISATDRPNQFAFLPDGSILVSERVKFDDAGTKLGARDLVLYKPNATTKACEVVRNLTQQDSDGGAAFSAATNFSLSPDGNQVAYVDFDSKAAAGSGAAAFSIWTVAVNGLTPPAQLSGAPPRGAMPSVGPRWLAGGALLAWPQELRSIDAGATTDQAIMVAASGGGGVHVVAKSVGFKKAFAIGNGSACAIASAGGSGLAAFGALGALVALISRRRRRT